MNTTHMLAVVILRYMTGVIWLATRYLLACTPLPLSPAALRIKNRDPVGKQNVFLEPATRPAPPDPCLSFSVSVEVAVDARR